MADKVKMYHKELGATFMAPASAVEHYKERGWKIGDLPKKKVTSKPKEDATD